MRQYELTYLISDNVPESELNKVTGKIGGYISGLEGKILKEEIWGRRKLAYPIKKQDFATYVTVNLDLPADKANELEHNIFLSSKIVRHILLVKDYGGEKELVLTAEDIAETEDIKEVVGGERSFEAVEGETEESKDLMAVRGEEEAGDEEEAVKEVIEEPQVEEKPKESVEEIKAEKSPATKKVKEAKEVKPTVKTETDDKKEKTAKKPAKKVVKKEDEADRLSKLDKELDDILGDEL